LIFYSEWVSLYCNKVFILTPQENDKHKIYIFYKTKSAFTLYFPSYISFSSSYILDTLLEERRVFLYIRINMNTIIKIIDDQKDLNSQNKSDLYINIFGEEPWNEWYQCKKCWKLFGLSDSTKNNIQQCLCGSELEKFYDKDDVDTDRLERSNRQGYICKLAQTLESRFIGFIMWRETNIEDLNSDKLGLDQDQIDILIKNINDNFEDFDLREFFYGAELWVEKDFRWKGIGSWLYKERAKELINKNIKYILIRTTKKTDKPYKWYQKEWFVTVFDYKDQQDRVIMIKNIL